MLASVQNLLEPVVRSDVSALDACGPGEEGPAPDFESSEMVGHEASSVLTTSRWSISPRPKPGLSV